MKVFIVTSGQYDDYRIEGVFSSREKAEEFMGIEQFNRLTAENPGAASLAIRGHWLHDGMIDLGIEEISLDVGDPFVWRKLTEREWNPKSKDNPGRTLIASNREGK